MLEEPLLTQDTTIKTIAFYLFINTSSGSKIGSKYLSIEAESITFRLKQGNITVYFYDLLNKQMRNKGLQELAKNIDEYDNRVIICGGDGTVLWVLQQIANAEINFSNITFGVIPIGTGNDFARSLGWGSKPITFSQNNLANLKKQILQWIAADVSNYDIWDCEIKFYQKGKMVSIEGKRQVTKKLQIYNRSFSNYFGLGIDARIGFSFEKRRTKHAITNLICYGCIGLFKWCQSINAIDDLVETMESHNEQWVDFNLTKNQSQGKDITYQKQQKQETNEVKNQNQQQQIITQKPIMTKTPSQQQQLKKQLVFHTNSSEHGQKSQLKRGFRNLLGLNSRSYMAGATGVWSTRKEAVVGQNDKNKFHTSDFGDGQLQFCSFESQFQLGLQRYLPGRSHKVGQGPGPFVINFRKPQTHPVEAYFQIDGQFFKLYNVQSIKITKTKLIQGSKIKVMTRRL